MKTCSRCKETMELAAFHPQKQKYTRRDGTVRVTEGYQNYCKVCTKLYKRTYNEQNKEKVREQQRAWREAHPTYMQEYWTRRILKDMKAAS